MTATSTPADLAAAFRSFSRRLHEAMAPVAADQEYAASLGVTGLEAEIEGEVKAAASDLGVTAEGDLGHLAGAVADEIEHRRAEEWGPHDLEHLQEHATKIGTTIRTIADRVHNG